MIRLQFRPIRVPLWRTRRNEAAADALEAEVRAFAEDLKKDFEATVKDWKQETRPKFEVKSSRAGNKVTYTVYTNSKIYLWVNSGTRRHTIVPRRKRALKLALAKTRTITYVKWVTIAAVQHPTHMTEERKGGSVVVKWARHPGIKKRDYVGMIMRVRKPTFSLRMHRAISIALGTRTRL